MVSHSKQKESVVVDTVNASMTGEEVTNAGGVVGKINKPDVGIFSNIATKVRNAMSAKGIDERNTEPEVAAAAIITRALFETLEQDAISSKKVE
jgi:hypothetical protein